MKRREFIKCAATLAALSPFARIASANDGAGGGYAGGSAADAGSSHAANSATAG